MLRLKILQNLMFTTGNSMKILLFVVLAFSLDGAMGCKNRCGYFVECDCLCKAYQINDERGTCAECEHEGNSKRGEMEVYAKRSVENYNFFQRKKH